MSTWPITVGNSQTGFSVGYGACSIGPKWILGINYSTNGQTPPCCYDPVLPDPYAVPPGILSADCAFQTHVVPGGKGIIKSGPTCHCGTPVEESTWGQLKSLYVD